jgi:hypothetical protein
VWLLIGERRARTRARQREQGRVGAGERQQRDQKDAIAEPLAAERGEPGGDLRRLGDQRRVPDRAVEHDLAGRGEQHQAAGDRQRRAPAPGRKALTLRSVELDAGGGLGAGAKGVPGAYGIPGASPYSAIHTVLLSR